MKHWQQVLIESDWNLKQDDWDIAPDQLAVLIESDWNLKKPCNKKEQVPSDRINRIRLEFKALLATVVSASSVCINRIRLEFKVGGVGIFLSGMAAVLIESDWNLKLGT